MTEKSETASLYFSDSTQPEKIEPLIAKCCELSNNGIKTIHLAINTGGGNIDSVIYAYNMLSGLPCKLITYNVSVVDSAGVALFCAGEERYANPNTSFLFHDLTWGRENLTADQLDLMVKSLRLSAEKMCQVITKATPLKIADVMEMFQKGATIGATKALSLGLINEVRPFAPTTSVMRVPVQS